MTRPRYGETMAGDDTPVTGIVLGGGGARGSFQVGALAYLYDHTDLAPTVFTGCSIGSVMAAKLATGVDRSHQRTAVEAVDGLIRGFEDHRGMSQEEEWFADVAAQAPDAGTALQQLQQLRDIAEDLPGAIVGGSGADTERPTVGETVGALKTLAQSVRGIGPVVQNAFRARSLYNLDPLRALLGDASVFGLDAVPDSGATLRVALVGLESGELRFVTEDGGFVDRDNTPRPDLGTVDLTDAVLASASMPGVFPPVKLGDEHYIDGGVRTMLPVDIAVEQLGVDRGVAILAQSPGVDPPELDATTILPVVGRALAQIALEEIRRDDVDAAHRAGFTVIEPQINVHRALEFEPEQISIAIDYGWMRAADVIEDLPEDQRLLSLEITQSRLRMSADPDPAVKSELRDLLATRDPRWLPPELRED